MDEESRIVAQRFTRGLLHTSYHDTLIASSNGYNNNQQACRARVSSFPLQLWPVRDATLATAVPRPGPTTSFVHSLAGHLSYMPRNYHQPLVNPQLQPCHIHRTFSSCFSFVSNGEWYFFGSHAQDTRQPSPILSSHGHAVMMTQLGIPTTAWSCAEASPSNASAKYVSCHTQHGRWYDSRLDDLGRSCHVPNPPMNIPSGVLNSTAMTRYVEANWDS